MPTKTARVRSGSHRRKRGGVWWYRRDVPKDARPAFEWPSAKHGGVRCVTAVWESLHTTDDNEAKGLEKIKDVEFERRLRAARDKNDPEKRRARAVVAYMENVPEETVRVLGAIQRGGIGVAAYEEAGSINAALRERWQKQSNIAGLLREIAAMMPGLPVESWERCQRDLLNVIRHYVSTSPPTNPVIDAPEICFWETIFEKWANEMKPVPKTVYSWKGIVRKLVSHLANNPKLTVAQAMTWNAAAITQGDLINWKDSLVTKIGPTTVRNHLTIFRTLYNYAADNKLLPKAVAEAVKGVKHKAKKRPGTRRLGYTDDEARAILTAARAELDPVLRFSPWLAATLGTRIDEICGAMVPDVEIEHDAVWFNIRLDYREVDPDQVAEIKSDNAERKLPIPPAVWRDEGFADYIAGLPENGPLFPHLKPDRFGRRGGNGSKRVQRWVRNKVGIKDKRKAPSHSWRHRFRSILRNPTYGIGEDVADYMAGHGGEGSVGRDYGEYRDAMVVAISRLPPPLPPERQLAACNTKSA